MRAHVRLSLLVVAVISLVAAALPASADHIPARHRNMDMLFHSQNAFDAVNSDLAFWGDLAFAGNYAGFRIFDIADPANPGSPPVEMAYPVVGTANAASLAGRPRPPGPGARAAGSGRGRI